MNLTMTGELHECQTATKHHTQPDSDYRCSCGAQIWMDGSAPVCVVSRRTLEGGIYNYRHPANRS